MGRAQRSEGALVGPTTAGPLASSKRSSQWMRKQLAAPDRGCSRWVRGHMFQHIGTVCPQSFVAHMRCFLVLCSSTGLVVCLVLLFIDQKNAKDPYPTAGSGSAGQDGVGKTEEEIAREGGIPAPKAQLLNTFLASQKGDGFLYPKNATGYYRGTGCAPLSLRWESSGRLSCRCLPMCHM